MDDFIKVKGKMSVEFDSKRFRRLGNRMLFKSRIAMSTDLGRQRYGEWYEFATIPPDLMETQGITAIVARAFIAGGHQKLQEWEVRHAWDRALADKLAEALDG